MTTSHYASGRVDTSLEPETLDLVDDFLETARELARVSGEDLGFRIALICLPAIVDDDVVVAVLVQVFGLDGSGDGKDGVFADVASESIPCVPVPAKGGEYFYLVI